MFRAYASLITQERPLFILVPKDQRVKVTSQVRLHLDDNFVWIYQLHSNFTYVSHMTQECPILILGSTGQRLRSKVGDSLQNCFCDN